MEKELKEIASCKKDLFVRQWDFGSFKNKLFYYTNKKGAEERKGNRL